MHRMKCAYFVMVPTSSTPRAMWFRDISCSGASAELTTALSFHGALLSFRGGTDFQKFSPR